MIHFFKFIILTIAHVFLGAWVVGLWFYLRSVIRNGAGELGGDWPELTVAFRRDESRIGFWLGVAFYGVLFAMLVLAMALLLYYDVTGTEYRPPWSGRA
ncbi:MAG TPA: hypothetical protein VN668_12130 [Stellaceae bacterium]|nr:hypothetical protein [Stellaceae bacterium]